MHGEPALPADFAHLPYANPDAPKGGAINYAWPGTFDSINPFIVQGSGARGSLDLVFGNNVFETLMMRSSDEPFTLYPLLAKTIETDDERSFAEFTLDERAKFSDGEAGDARGRDLHAASLLAEKGLPRYGVTASKIAKVEKVGERGVRFTFKQPDRELPLILGLFPILPKHAIDAETFDKSTLKPMIGSGPYRLETVKAGDSLTFRRNPDYWAKDIPVEARLRQLRHDHADLFPRRERHVRGVQEGAGRRLHRREQRPLGEPVRFPGGDARRHRQGDAEDEAAVRHVRHRHEHAGGRSSRTPKLRAALIDLFDFEWANRSLFSGVYTRTKSFFDNSDLSSSGRPASEAEKALLAPFPDAVTPEIMASGWTPPTSDGSGLDRAFMRIGFEKLKQAGYTLKDGRLAAPDGKPVTFEIMLKSNENQQVAVAYQQTLAKLGIAVTVRSVDAAQFLQRQINYDFDAMFFNYTASLSPGVEQVARWGSAAKDKPGTFNYAGVADPAVDAMIDALINARTRDEFVEAVRAYDRVLLSGAYVIPLYFRPEQWIARWKRIERPDDDAAAGIATADLVACKKLKDR